jgi:soluble lytic murein transglycosylase-like protein
MLLERGIGVGLLLAAAACAAESHDAGRQVYTVGVDARTGKLVRVPATRYSRPVLPKTVSARSVPARVIEAREVRAESDQQPPPVSNIANARSFDELVEQVAGRYAISPHFVHAVIQAESNYNPRAVSPKGALGLMQLMPQTARRFGVANAFNPAENLEGGVRYLRYLLDLYSNYRLSLAAYNAGEGAVDRFGGVPPYSETRRYLRRVDELYERYRRYAAPVTPAPAPKKLEGPRIWEVRDASGVTRYTTESQ